MSDHQGAVFAALADRYDIDGELGRGGMATVYRARDKRHESDVAIKILRPELVQALGGERFTREVRVTAGLQHPHILPLLDSGEADGLPFYVMPFVAGASLAQRLEQQGPLAIGEAVQFISEIADGLDYAHARGLIHRDIKPANILLSNGHALLADFGIARVLDTADTQSLTDSGLALGTAGYMSPEQAAGERVDGRSDIYALGCVLYELLAGSPPFMGSSQRAIMARHAVDPVPSVRTVRTEVPPTLEAVIKRALAKVPGDRYATAGEFRDAVRASLLSTAEFRELTARSASRTRWVAAGGIALVATVAAIAGVMTGVFGTPKPIAPVLSANRVMVFPLLLPADWQGARTSGEDVSTMIGSAMDGAGALRWIDAWQLLSPARRDDMRSLPDSEANALARAQHCRFVVTGRVASRSGDSVEVLLTLRDLQSDSVVARPRGAALAREPWRAGLGAVSTMLPTLIPGGGADLLRDWTALDPQAVAQYLAGESAFRRLRLKDALKNFKAAVETDSTFGIAALRGAQVASWSHAPADAIALVTVASSHLRLPRDKAFAAGLAAYLNGQADSAIVALRSALSIDREMSAAWMQLSETYLHLLPSRGKTEVMAAAALDSAFALDSTATPLLFHRIEIAVRAGQAARADSLARRFAAVASDTAAAGAAADTMLIAEVRLMAACANGRWTAASIDAAARQQPAPLLFVVKSMGFAQPACVRDGYRAMLRLDTANTSDADGRRWFSLVGLHAELLARGHADSAMTEIDRFYQRWQAGTSLYLVDAPVIGPFVDRARKVAADDSIKYGVNYATLTYPSRLWALGIWAALDGRVSTAQAIAEALTARAARRGQPLDSVRMDSLRAAAVLAHVTLARGDTTAAIRRFNALLGMPMPSTAISWEEEAAFGLQRLTLGRLYLARRQYDEARGVLEVLDSSQPASFPLFTPIAWRLRLQAAESLGDATEATMLRQRLSALGASRAP